MLTPDPRNGSPALGRGHGSIPWAGTAANRPLTLTLIGLIEMTETLADYGHRIGIACTCCVLATVNDDTSACEDSCGDDHAERLAEYGTEPGETVVIDLDSDNGFAVFRCVGCGDDVAGTGLDVYVTN